MIYKNMHQVWLDGSIPTRYIEWIRSVKDCHPGWKYKLWNRDDIRKLISDKYIWFLPTYDSYSHDIQRCDSARYFILHEYGGVYMDIDIECYMNVEPLINGECVLFYEHPGGAEYSTPGEIITNSLYYADRHNKFIRNCTRNLKIWKQRADKYTNIGTHVFYSTSPGFMSHMYYRYRHVNDIKTQSYKRFELLTKKQRKDILYNNTKYNTQGMYGTHWNVGEWLLPGDTSKVDDHLQA